MSKVAVVIPYKPKWQGQATEIFEWVLDGFAKQVLPNDTLEILIGFDGGGENFQLKLPESKHVFKTYNYPHVGNAIVKNYLVKETQADLLIFSNGDTRPEIDMVQQHVATMATLPERSIILGSAPFILNSPTTFDLLLDTTPLIFSFCYLKPEEWYPFKLTYTLNLSTRTSEFREVGGFPELIRPYAYEDTAYGYRIMGTRNGLFYQPKAKVLHRHPMTFEQYLNREELMGMMAPVLGIYYPEVYHLLMDGRDVKNLAESFRQKLQLQIDGTSNLYHYLKTSLEF